jgi:hypothetical protein
MDELFGHPSSALFFVALAVLFCRWAPGSSSRVGRVLYYAFAAMAGFIAAAYPLRVVAPWVAGVALLFAVLLWFFTSARVTELGLSASLPEGWKRQRLFETYAVLGGTVIVMFIWQKAS